MLSLSTAVTTIKQNESVFQAALLLDANVHMDSIYTHRFVAMLGGTPKMKFFSERELKLEHN